MADTRAPERTTGSLLPLEALDPRRRGDDDWERGDDERDSCVSFNPTIPARISPRQTSRPTVAGSLNSTMPSTTVPTAPMPVHTA